jgi:hypothetical protein
MFITIQLIPAWHPFPYRNTTPEVAARSNAIRLKVDQQIINGELSFNAQLIRVCSRVIKRVVRSLQKPTLAGKHGYTKITILEQTVKEHN